jgi:hypothetical protein
VPDSDDDDEDYGWQDEDDGAMPAMPPQWQGSEDLLLGRDDQSSEEELDDESIGDKGVGKDDTRDPNPRT